MSKLIAAGTAAVGGTATAIGGSYFLQRGSGTGTEAISPDTNAGGTDLQSTKTTTPITSEFNFQTLADFKKEKGGSCAKHYFGDLNYGTEGTLISSTAPVATEDFPGTPATGTEPKGCLVINWERTDVKDATDGTNKKWTGNFRWLWSFVNGDKGFVIFYTTKLSETDNQFDLEGGIYFVAKEAGDNKDWKISKYKEVSDTSKHIKDGDFEKHFPQVGDNFEGVQFSEKPNWGFMSGKEDLKTLCKKGTDTCPTGTTEQKSFKEVREWKVDSSLTNTPDKWSKSFNTSLTNLFGTIDGLDMSSSFTNFQGSWKQIVATQ